MTDGRCIRVLGSCTDKCPHHEGTGERGIGKRVYKNNRGAKEGESFRDYILYEATLVHEFELP